MAMRGRSSSRIRAPYGDDSDARVRNGPSGAGGSGQASTEGPPGGAGLVGRRRALPNGRAVAGAFFIAVAAVIVFATWLSANRSHRRDWVVAAQPLAAGTTLSSQNLRSASMQLPADTAGQAFRDPSALVGRVLAAPVGAGGLIQAVALVPSGHQPGLRPVSVSDSQVDLASVDPGDAVDVLVTEGNDTAAVTSVVVRNAQVISVTRPSNSVVGGANNGVVTIGVRNLAEVEAVVQASHAGAVTVVVAERSDGQGLGGGRVGSLSGNGHSPAAAPGSATASGASGAGSGSGGTGPGPGLPEAGSATGAG